MPSSIWDNLTLKRMYREQSRSEHAEDYLIEKKSNIEQITPNKLYNEITEAIKSEKYYAEQQDGQPLFYLSIYKGRTLLMDLPSSSAETFINVLMFYFNIKKYVIEDIFEQHFDGFGRGWEIYLKETKRG